VRSRTVPYIPLLLRGALRNGDLVPLIDVDPEFHFPCSEEELPVHTTSAAFLRWDVVHKGSRQAVPLHPVAPMWWRDNPLHALQCWLAGAVVAAQRRCVLHQCGFCLVLRGYRASVSIQSISSAQLAKMGGWGPSTSSSGSVAVTLVLDCSTATRVGISSSASPLVGSRNASSQARLARRSCLRLTCCADGCRV